MNPSHLVACSSDSMCFPDGCDYTTNPVMSRHVTDSVATACHLRGVVFVAVLEGWAGRSARQSGDKNSQSLWGNYHTPPGKRGERSGEGH